MSFLLDSGKELTPNKKLELQVCVYIHEFSSILLTIHCPCVLVLIHSMFPIRQILKR